MDAQDLQKAYDERDDELFGRGFDTVIFDDPTLTEDQVIDHEAELRQELHELAWELEREWAAIRA